jgi:DNA mismatch repair ATPase MutS
MCGFPLAHVDKYLKVLVQQHNRFVAMCEEFPRFSDKGIKEFDRRVVRVITPGSLIDEPFLNPFENNYLLAISCVDDDVDASEGCVGLAWIDVSTGEFFSRPSSYDNLRDELARIGPREVVLDRRLEARKSHPVLQALTEEDNFVSFVPLSEDASGRTVSSTADGGHVSEMSILSVPVGDGQTHPAIPLSPREATAIDILTTYLHANLLEHMPVLSLPNQEGATSRMQIDSHTIKALEIREGIREGGTKGSLLSVIKRTITSGGTRLLARLLCKKSSLMGTQNLREIPGSPSTSMAEINARQSVVAFFSTRPHFSADIAGALTDIEDIGRIVQRFIMGRGEPSDLLAVNRTIRTWSTVINRFKEERAMEAVERNRLHEADWTSIDTLISRMTDLQDLSTRITLALDDEYPSSSGDPLISEDSQVNDDKLDSAPFITEDNNLWRYGSGKWTIKPEYFPVFILDPSIDNFEQVFNDINNAPWHTSGTLSKKRMAREGPPASIRQVCFFWYLPRLTHSQQMPLP